MIRFFELHFKRNKEWTGTIQDADFGFYIPGVNSGVYDPTLHVNASITEKIAGLFSFATRKTCATITLRPQEFDELYAEMTKIKKLRDALNTP